MNKNGRLDILKIIVFIAVLFLVGWIAYNQGYQSGFGNGVKSVPATNVPAVNTPAQTTQPAQTTPSTPSANPTPTAPVAVEKVIDIINYTIPKEVTVKIGDTVTWVNKDLYDHEISANNLEFPPSRPLHKGDSYSFTFTRAGNYPYHCALHANDDNEKGVIIVK